MPDQVTTTTTKGYGSRIGDSIKGIAFGLLLFVVSFVVLYLNEGRTDLSLVAKKSIDIPSATISANDEGKFVSVSGDVSSAETVGDAFVLKPGAYISYKRTVEMYAWDETKKETTQKNFGGSETTTTTYTYALKWTSAPQNSSNFKEQAGHQNPGLPVQSSVGRVQSAKIGAYTFATTDLTVYGEKPLVLTSSNTTLSGKQKVSADGKYVFSGNGSLEQPQVGDVRLSYDVLSGETSSTIFGKRSGPAIVSYTDDKDNVMFHLFSGSRSAAIATLHQEYVTIGWFLRALGFLMMWFGLFSVFAPISVLLDVIPALGSIGKGLISVITFLIALPLSILTIVVSMIVHNVIALLITAVVGAAILGYVGMKFVKKRQLAPVTVPNS